MCDGEDHRSAECPSKASASQNEPVGRVCRYYCFECGAMRHETRMIAKQNCSDLNLDPEQG